MAKFYSGSGGPGAPKPPRENIKFEVTNHLSIEKDKWSLIVRGLVSDNGKTDKEFRIQISEFRKNLPTLEIKATDGVFIFSNHYKGKLKDVPQNFKFFVKLVGYDKEQELDVEIPAKEELTTDPKDDHSAETLEAHYYYDKLIGKIRVFVRIIKAFGVPMATPFTVVCQGKSYDGQTEADGWGEMTLDAPLPGVEANIKISTPGIGDTVDLHFYSKTLKTGLGRIVRGTALYSAVAFDLSGNISDIQRLASPVAIIDTPVLIVSEPVLFNSLRFTRIRLRDNCGTFILGEEYYVPSFSVELIPLIEKFSPAWWLKTPSGRSLLCLIISATLLAICLILGTGNPILNDSSDLTKAQEFHNSIVNTVGNTQDEIVPGPVNSNHWLLYSFTIVFMIFSLLYRLYALVLNLGHEAGELFKASVHKIRMKSKGKATDPFMERLMTDVAMYGIARKKGGEVKVVNEAGAGCEESKKKPGWMAMLGSAFVLDILVDFVLAGLVKAKK